MFYFTETALGSGTPKKIGIPGEDIDKIYESGAGSVIELKASNRVYSSPDSITDIYATNKNYALILVTSATDSLRYIFPANTIKNLRELPAGCQIFFRSTKMSNFIVTESVDTIVDNISSGGGSSNPFYTQQVQTLDATPTLVPISFPIPNNSVQSFVTRLTAIEGATGDTWSHEFRGAIKNLGGTTTMVESPTDETLAEDAGAALWSAAFTANANTLEINVTGEAAHTIEWKAETLFSGVTY